ncbi:MAG: bifunctional UDP-N-acetylglucosamine diphosphorylase/glucosamine-1-phosphate N-acetyltransferase GlmU [Bdellovibrionota bacterium]
MSFKIEKLQVIVLAAGQGTRMRSAVPKVLHRVCGYTLVGRALRAAAGLKPARIVVVVGYGEELVRKELAQLQTLPFLEGIPLHVAVQSEQRGTGHAVQSAMGELSANLDHVLIMPGDCPLIETEQLAALANGAPASGLSFLTCDLPDPRGFGRVVRSSSGAVQGIVEQKDCSPEQLAIKEINSSIYLSDYKFLVESLKSIQCNNAQGEYYLTDIVQYGVSQKLPVTAHKLSDCTPLLGANDRAELSQLERMRRDEINRRLMESGVTLEDPAQVYVDDDVLVGRDSYLGAGVRLRGRTVIGGGVTIDGNSIITNSKVGDQTRIKLSCSIDDTDIGPRCEIGPFAHLRPGSKLHDGVKIGNFVETKKAELESGAKVNHLTYIGDAYVGEHVNVGAGTITCNYDGVNKHRTVIEAGAFIGSNSCLVAPVKVGEGAYIGAGSTITKDVPPGSLGIGRARQENVSGWASKKQRSKTGE